MWSLRAEPEQDALLRSAEEAGVRVLVESRPGCAQTWRQRAGGGALKALPAIAGLSLLALVAWRRSGGPARADEAASTVLTEASQCAGQGQDCRAAGCCQNGGKDGLQCYARDDNWAQCDETCVAGVHDNEKAIGFDRYGKPKTPTWSCKEVGARSEPGCSSYRENHCPTSRCEWKDSTCREPCSSAAVCTAHDYCSWNGKECLDACWTYGIRTPGDENTCLSKTHSTRCEWKDEKCAPACWTHGTSDECWRGDKCLWQNSCKDDPCSAPGEDCSRTRCCSGLRGGGGMTCYEKDQYYATCSKGCTADGEAEPPKDWSCKELGNRTRTQTHCAWAGEECSSVGMCCNKGFVCAVKDEYFTGCVQTFTQLSFKKEKVPYPPGWPAEPKFIGGGQFEYAMQPVAPGEGMGTSLYCIMAYLPKSYEERLMEIARASSASVFACDDHDLFHTWKSGWESWDTKATTLTNIDVFIDVWEQVRKVGKLWKYDWTVKVDPDCLLVPQRLKWHLAALNAPKKQPIYVKNNNLNASIGNNGFLGAVEVFSREALELYFDWYPKCNTTIGNHGGEDGFMKGCMDAMGVGYITDGFMFKPDNDPRVCKDGKYAAYHPLKIQENFQCCVDVVNGGDHFMEWGACKDLNADWLSKVWPHCAEGGTCRDPQWR